LTLKKAEVFFIFNYFSLNNIDQGSNSIDIYKIIYLYKKNNKIMKKFIKKKL